jgi:hypothetical protein
MHTNSKAGHCTFSRRKISYIRQDTHVQIYNNFLIFCGLSQLFFQKILVVSKADFKTENVFRNMGRVPHESDTVARDRRMKNKWSDVNGVSGLFGRPGGRAGRRAPR